MKSCRECSHYSVCYKMQEELPMDLSDDCADYEPAGSVTKIFADINKEIVGAINNNRGVLNEHYDKHKEPNYEFVALVNGKITALQGINDFITHLKKKYEV